MSDVLDALRWIEKAAETLRENAVAEGHDWEADDAEAIRDRARAAIAQMEGRA